MRRRISTVATLLLLALAGARAAALVCDLACLQPPRAAAHEAADAAAPPACHASAGAAALAAKVHIGQAESACRHDDGVPAAVNPKPSLSMTSSAFVPASSLTHPAGHTAAAPIARGSHLPPDTYVSPAPSLRI